MEHVWLSLKSKTYWEFSYSEMAEHDVPAQLSYITKQTETE